MNWPTATLFDALKSAEVFVDGDWVESKDQDPDGDVRLIQLADIGDGIFVNKSARFLTNIKARELRCTFLRVGDILVSRMSEPLGRACIFPGDSKKSVTVVDVCVIRPDPKQHDARWLMHSLNSPACRHQVLNFGTGTTRLRISRRNLGKIVMPILPLPEQRRIARILDQVEELRAKRHEALVRLDELMQSIFLDMFGDPVANPRGWPVVAIGEILQSASYGTSEKAGTYGEFPVLRMGNLTSTGEIDLSDLKYMDLSESKRDRYLVRRGDVLFNRTNSADLVGKTAIYRLEKQVAYAGYLVRLRTNDRADPEYLAAYLNTGQSKAVLRGMCKSIIGMANINAKQVQAMTIPLAPLNLQEQFARRVEAIERLKVNYRAHLAELDTLFASLQYRAFRGEL